MKKIRILLSFCIIILLSACKNDEVNDTLQSEISKFNNPYEALVKLEDAILKLSVEPSFVKLVHNEVEKKFDGDYNGLIERINKSGETVYLKSANLLPEIESIISYLNSKNLYPQIYIPKFDEINNSVTPENKNGIYIINAFSLPDSVTRTTGLFVDNQGNIKKTDFLIDEEFATKNEVWVLSFNERMNQDFEKFGENKSARVGTKSEYLIKINCVDLNAIEGWLKGAPELRCVMKSAKGEITDQYFFPGSRKSIGNAWWYPNGSTGRYLYYWDIETYTKTVLFYWIEEDDSGSTVTTSGSFVYKDIDKNTGLEFTATTAYQISYKSDDKPCGSISLHIDDGRVGEEYNTGLIRFTDDYK